MFRVCIASALSDFTMMQRTSPQALKTKPIMRCNVLHRRGVLGNSRAWVLDARPGDVGSERSRLCAKLACLRPQMQGVRTRGCFFAVQSSFN